MTMFLAMDDLKDYWHYGNVNEKLINVPDIQMLNLVDNRTLYKKALKKN